MLVILVNACHIGFSKKNQKCKDLDPLASIIQENNCIELGFKNETGVSIISPSISVSASILKTKWNTKLLERSILCVEQERNWT